MAATDVVYLCFNCLMVKATAPPLVIINTSHFIVWYRLWHSIGYSVGRAAYGLVFRFLFSSLAACGFLFVE